MWINRILFRDEGDGNGSGGAGDGTGGDGQQQQQTAEPWYQKLPEALHGAAKKFTSPKTLIEGAAAILKSNQSLRTDLATRPARGSVVVPGEGSTEEEIAAYRTARGIPEKAESYHLEGVDVAQGTLPGESGVNTELLAKAQKLAHENGMTQAQFTNLVKANPFLITGRQPKAAQADLMRAEQESDAYLKEHFGDQTGPNKTALVESMKNLMGAQGEDAVWLTEFFDMPVESPSGIMQPLKQHPLFLRYMFVLSAMTGGERFLDPSRRQGDGRRAPDNPADFDVSHMTDQDFRALYGDAVVDAIQTGNFRDR